MGEYNMKKIDELKDYLVDKKDNVKNYILDRKENIKTGAKKAVATGLVVSTLLSGAAMTTGCEKLPDDSGEAAYEEAVRALDDVLESVDVDFSDITIFEDAFSYRQMILFAEKDGQKNACYAITKKTYDKLRALALVSGKNIEIRDKTMSISRDKMDNDLEFKPMLDEIYSKVKDATPYEYSLKNRFNLRSNGFDAFDDAKEETQFLCNTIRDIEPEDDNYFNPVFCEFFYNDIDGTSLKGYTMNVHGYYNSEKDDSDARLSVKNFLVDKTVADKGLWQLFKTYLEEYEDGENIWKQEGRYCVNVDVFADGKYEVLGEIARPVVDNSDPCRFKITDDIHGTRDLDYTDIYYDQVVGKQYSLFPEEDQMTK